MRGENDNPDQGEALEFGASRLAVFLPFLTVALGCGALLAGLAFSGNSGTAPAWLCVAALVLSLPLLAAHAVLRLLTVRVRALERSVQIRSGFPQARGGYIPYALIRDVSVSRRSRLHSGGSLTLTLVDGTEVFVPDVSKADEAKRAIWRLAEEHFQAAAARPRRAWHRDEETATVG